jgi:uncharacterized repeat protein (TIGR01451 family)
MVRYVLTGVFLFTSFIGHVAYGTIGSKLTIGNINQQDGAPYFYATLDASGYSDWIYYGKSPDHDYGYHELLSGEWGSAGIYYDGIATNSLNDPNRPNQREMMWLTQCFEFPTWQTNSNFTAAGTSQAWNNPSNPVPQMNTGHSSITNADVEITVDYEVVDLESLGATYSPMSFLKDPNGGVGYMYSDRYMFLQTFTLKNIKSVPLTNLEFYQFLHSHGADVYGPYVNSTYCDVNLQDPLANYTPYNPVHQTGNFRYDITQWNSPQAGSHVDYISFSSTIEPDWVDNGTFDGHGGKPAPGSHTRLETRSLNGIDGIFNAEAAGAMGWSFGSLDPNETTSITFAFMFGTQQETPDLILSKTDDVELGQCVWPNSPLQYTLSWQNVGFADAQNAVLVDYLPKGVIPANIFDSRYDMFNHTWKVEIGTIPASGQGETTIDVIVTEQAEPGMPMVNKAVLTSSLGQVSAHWSTKICNWDEGGIIHVNSRATGADTGTSWRDAYTDLQRALARATATGGNAEIWVASGTGPYDPGRQPDTSFVIPANTKVYGGFSGSEILRDQRNPKRNVTVLTGAADSERNTTVVTIGGSNCLLDGLTITSADEHCIYGSGVDFTLEQSTLQDSREWGLRTTNCNVEMRNCYVRGHGSDGIRHDGEGKVLQIDNCWIMKNMARGLASQGSTPYIRNSILTESDLSEYGNPGIRILNPTSRPILHGCSFAHNRGPGIDFEDDRTIADPNTKDYPDVANCILWYNQVGKGDRQFNGFGVEYIQHSAIFDPNDPDGIIEDKDIRGNFSTNPKFVFVDPNFLYLRQDSPCKDAGSPDIDYTGQVDFAGRSRVIGDYADIGAYEIVPSDDPDTNDLDWDHDGNIDFDEFSLLSRAWGGIDPNCPEIIADPNLSDPNASEGWYEWKYQCNVNTEGDSAYTVDFADFLTFVDAPWLWRASWLPESDTVETQELMFDGGEEMLLMGGDFMQMMAEPVVLQPEPTIEEQVLQLQDAIAFLEQIWLEEPDLQQEIDAEDWQAFLDAVYQNLLDLQTGSVQLE